ncbi:MAG: AAA family ATPase [Pseudomonadota bacterium]
MIKYFTVKNFRSIKNESILEFDANPRREIACPAHPLIGLAGANASGKTALLQALSFVFWFLQDSFLTQAPDEEIPLDAFCTQKDKPTRFHLIFYHNRIDYEYQLYANKEKVIFESLHYSHQNAENQCAYIREDKTVKFGEQISKISTSGLRQNSSIISYAAQDDTQVIAKSCKEYIVRSNVSHGGFREEHFKPQRLEKMIEDEYFQTRLPAFLPIADVGIETVALKKADEEELNKLLANLDDKNKERFPKELLDMLRTKTEFDRKQLVFTHQIEGRMIDFSSSERESTGTLQFLILLYRILSTLENGHLLILDEIELNLHQNLVAFLIRLFQNPDENSNCAQLIFSFHNAAFMEMLMPEQLWFAEKNDKGQTEFFPAADFQDIKDLHQKNLEKLYRIGRFGATPRGL